MKQQIDVRERLDQIKQHLELDDPQFQASALNSLIFLINNEKLTHDQISDVLPFFEKNLKNPDQSIKIELFDAICNLGIYNFKIIKHIFQDIIEELQKKNRFTIKIILDMISKLMYLNYLEIKNCFKDIVENGIIWFKEPYLEREYKEFITNIISNNFQIFNSYPDEIKIILDTYPENYKDIKNQITEKSKNFDQYLENLRIKKIEEEKLRVKQEAIRSALLEKNKAEKEPIIESSDKLSDNIVVESGNPIVNSSSNISSVDTSTPSPIKSSNNSQIKVESTIPSKINGSNPTESLINIKNLAESPNIDGVNNISPDNKEINNINSNSTENILTFTNLGLKRREIDDAIDEDFEKESENKSDSN